MAFCGCASEPVSVGPASLPASTRITSPTLTPNVPGIYHRVEKGQTLWRISKIYNTDLDDIAQINHIPDTTSIEVGQQLFIPYAKKQQTVVVAPSTDDFIWPLKGRVISGFGQTFDNVINKGINISSSAGGDVLAVRSGKVVFYADNFGIFGKTLIIDHGDGFSTVYARNAVVFIRIGEAVSQGMVIAKAGATKQDRNRYLHFEIRKGRIPQNPLYYLP